MNWRTLNNSLQLIENVNNQKPMNMLRQNPDYHYIEKACPGYIDTLNKIDCEIHENYGCNLGMEFNDHDNTKLRYWIRKGVSKLGKEEHQAPYSLLESLVPVLNETCSYCGSNHDVQFRNELYHWKAGYVNQFFLCEECFENYKKEELRLSASAYGYFSGSPFFKWNPGDNNLYARKKIRFINSFERFDYANFGSYFFYGPELYVITNRKFYKDVDLKENFRDTVFYSHIGPDSFVIKGMYAGQDTGFRDDKRERVYTGDIIKLKGAHSNERDPHKYFGKDRYVAKEGQGMYEVYGVVSSYEFCREAYQVVLDNHGAFLCHGTELEILGTIFYDLVLGERIDIWQKACQIAQSGYDTNGFWRIHKRETLRDDLKKIKTPVFLDRKNE